MTVDELRLVLGANVLRRRTECGLSQRALGEVAGVSFAQINRIEKGVCSTPVDMLAKLSAALDTEPLFFLTPPSKRSAAPTKKILTDVA